MCCRACVRVWRSVADWRRKSPTNEQPRSSVKWPTKASGTSSAWKQSAIEVDVIVRFPPVADLMPGGDNVLMGTVERAFQLAPDCRTMNELRAKLVREGYTNIDAHLQAHFAEI
jgi:hypothetical protein